MSNEESPKRRGRKRIYPEDADKYLRYRKAQYMRMHPTATPEQIEVFMALPVGYRRHPAPVAESRFARKLYAKRKRCPDWTEEQIQEWAKGPGERVRHPASPNAEMGRAYRRRYEMQRRNPTWTEEQLNARIDYLDKLISGELQPNRKAERASNKAIAQQRRLSSLQGKEKRQRSVASSRRLRPLEEGEVIPAKPVEKKKEKTSKEVKIFPSTTGQLRYTVMLPETGGGYQKPYDILIDAKNEPAVRVKYEAKRAIFRGPMLA